MEGSAVLVHKQSQQNEVRKPYCTNVYDTLSLQLYALLQTRLDVRIIYNIQVISPDKTIILMFNSATSSNISKYAVVVFFFFFFFFCLILFFILGQNMKHLSELPAA